MSFYKAQRYFQQNPGEVQKQRKAVPFSVLDIGGAEELKKWRIAQEIKEIQYQTAKAERYEQTRAHVIQMVELQNSVVFFTPEEQAEARLKASTGVVNGVEAPVLAQEAPQVSQYEEPAPKASLGQRIKVWFSDLLQAAFPQ